MKLNIKGIITNLKPGFARGEAARHARRAYQRKPFSFSQTVFIAALIFLFLPLLVLILYSFNASKGMRWTGFSLVWYEQLFLHSRDLWRAFWNSILIAVSSAGTATVFGTLGAVGVNWYRFKLRNYVQTISFLPMILPEIIIGVSLSLFFAGIKMKLGLLTIFIAHTTFNLPFVFLMVMARLDEFDFSIIEAAHDLGANERQTFLKVTVPICMPGIVSGFLTAVTISLEDFVITYFVAGPGSTTLPLYIYSAIRFGVSPVINALSVVMILGTVALTYLLRNFLKYIAAK
ncbi:spermidine/putrescine transport system permease protein PotC [Treponema primitia ZAS-2]|uniref:Spermidine/putrescine transport system permease protein PotC n=1 Tax=Treponema primitia (strain ATCC BAA-887 / DSM 12427 / ZAS-2) TaxID=545694 RepID=F5YKS3_TREPZ|nr:ABC transporter permease [Treponema primitia]AEF83757.1 spermidine/putrescine transport system permease protein PotC [Treponema primitia ZAS-2]